MRFAALSLVLLLALVPVLLGLFALAFRRRRRALEAFVEAGLADRLLPREAGLRRWLRPALMVGAVACLVVALMQPQWGERDEDLPFRGRDLVVVLDVSLSMLAEDISPNRLEVAKDSVRLLVDAARREGGHRLGLVVFAGRADVYAPLTRDYELFLARLEDASPASVSRRGTAIELGLAQAMRTFGAEPAYTDLVLLTDGEDHAGLPQEAARELGARGVGLYVVAVGDDAHGGGIPIGGSASAPQHLAYEGQEVVSRVRPGLLTAMAEAAGGDFLHARYEPARLDRLYADHIAAKPRRELERASSDEAAHRFGLFALLALLLLAAEMLVREGSEGRWRKAAIWHRLLPARLRPAALGLAALLPVLGGDEAARQAVLEGNALYHAGSYEAALERYAAAAEALPDAPEVAFNRAAALFRTRNYPDALEHYLGALRGAGPELASRAHYNLGVIKYREALAATQRYEDALSLAETAIGYFRESLSLDSGYEDARYNLELAYRLRQRVEEELLAAQRDQEMPGERTSLRRGQEQQQRTRNEGHGQRSAAPELDSRPHGQRGGPTPENFAANPQGPRPSEPSRLPMAMSPEAAADLLEEVGGRMQAAEARRDQQRRAALATAAETRPW
jgi:Ca-activated chloride channel homolog